MEQHFTDDARMYQALDQITQQEIANILQLGGDIDALLRLAIAGKWQLGLNRIAGLVAPSGIKTRDHLIQLHLGNIVSYLHRSDYRGLGILARNLLYEWSAMTEDAKQEIITTGYPIVVRTGSSSKDFVELAPLPHVKDSEYTSQYEKLEKAWDCKNQTEMGERMVSLLKTIHNTLSPAKVGKGLYRVRSFKGQPRREPLPLYVRNEIHHPSVNERYTWQFEQDKRRAFAIMNVWLSDKAEAQCENFESA